MVRFGFRVPSLKKCLSARMSVKRYVRNSLGLKAPRGWGWVTNPMKAAYNRAYNRTTRGCLVVVVAGIASIGFLVAAIAADTTEKRRASPRRPAVAERQRAAAPTGWDKMVRDVFLEDAFSILGDRRSAHSSNLVTRATGRFGMGPAVTGNTLATNYTLSRLPNTPPGAHHDRRPS